MKPAARATKWAKLVSQFHQLKRGPADVMFGDACFCGGSIHKWGDRAIETRVSRDGKQTLVAPKCPARSEKKNQANLKALGETLKAVEVLNAG